jgi:hypothetical protein
MKRHKKISHEEALTYIACGVLFTDCEDGFDGDITCTYSDDGVDVYVTDSSETSKTEISKYNQSLN